MRRRRALTARERPPCAERRLPPARRLATQTEIGRQLRQTHQELFDAFKVLQATGLSISIIAQQLGCNRRRLDKWAQQSVLPERQKMHPTPGSAETFREYLRQRWDAGYRNGRVLVDDLRALGYKGTYKAVGKILSVSNSWSGGEGELDEVPAVRDPAHIVQIGRDHRVLTGEGQRRVAL